MPHLGVVKTGFKETTRQVKLNSQVKQTLIEIKTRFLYFK